jgi:hypothetical protein
MERVICWVFIYPGEMHRPCGHVVRGVAPFTFSQRPNINNRHFHQFLSPPQHSKTMSARCIDAMKWGWLLSVQTKVSQYDASPHSPTYIQPRCRAAESDVATK